MWDLQKELQALMPHDHGNIVQGEINLKTCNVTTRVWTECLLLYASIHWKTIWLIFGSNILTSLTRPSYALIS